MNRIIINIIKNKHIKVIIVFSLRNNSTLTRKKYCFQIKLKKNRLNKIKRNVFFVLITRQQLT